MVEKVKFTKLKVWFVFIVLFVCGIMVGIGVANWSKNLHQNKIQVSDNSVAIDDNNINIEYDADACNAIERVLLSDLYNNDKDCYAVNYDIQIYIKLSNYACKENRDKFVQMAQNKQDLYNVVCAEFNASNVSSNKRTCEQIEDSLLSRLPRVGNLSSAEEHIDRAKIFAIMAERGCSGDRDKYGTLAKQELDIARAISDDKFDENETLEVVETYKRLKMQQDAEEIFEKAKKLTNPAIDFIMQVEKIVKE